MASALVTTLLVRCVTHEAADEAIAPKTLEPTKPLSATSVYVPGYMPNKALANVVPLKGNGAKKLISEEPVLRKRPVNLPCYGLVVGDNVH